ncbi:peroxiredoxin family protein [Leucothrix mucor]|uniref:peroxiredoxin family protein n=1 Tax=Leucothrix mucor TaxID=45248 RepID=UPI0003B631E8|nr:peroxiredoxin family protein [Leucothrix mucor]
MIITALGFALSGLVVCISGIVVYMLKVKRDRTPVVPVGLTGSLAVAIALALYSLFLVISGPIFYALMVSVISIITLLLSFKMLYMRAQKCKPMGLMTVKVSDKILPFETTTFEGKPFNSHKLDGKRLLIKFYRGSWCPYCSVELGMLEDIQPELAKYGIKIIALSSDQIDDAKAHRKRDGLSLKLLSDPELKVIRQYGIEHIQALAGVSSTIKSMLGLPFPTSMERRSIAIPTSLLVDEHGVVQWIDQSEDYRLRADSELVMEQVVKAFGEIPKSP